MTYDELFELACDWKDGECRRMRQMGSRPCCRLCVFYRKNGGTPCPLGDLKPKRCSLYLCHAAEFWLVGQFADGNRPELAEAYGRLKAAQLTMEYETFVKKYKSRAGRIILLQEYSEEVHEEPPAGSRIIAAIKKVFRLALGWKN